MYISIYFKGLTNDPQLSVGIFDAPVVFGDTLVHARIIKSQTGKLQLAFPILLKTHILELFRHNKCF